jgi:hypothetical protein
VRSALGQEILCGVGVVIVNDGCPDPETDRIGQMLRDADPGRLAYLHQPNRGLPAARNAGIRQALARWPQLDSIFPLDADNLLSPGTLAALTAVLEERPQLAWATPALEFFGAEEGEWQVPGPYLLYRQLLGNQCDAGSLIRRAVFDAGIEYDETMREGFEDWEFFLRASLAGFGGVQAGRCGFRYRRRSDSMVTAALAQRQRLEAEIQRRHPAAYEPAALLRREHAEAPRFALVRCDRDDVLLTACCDLEPRRVGLAQFARSIAAAGDPEPAVGDHIPAVTLLTTAAAIEGLEARGDLAETLFRIQSELREAEVVELRVGSAAAGLALRARALDRLAGDSRPEPEAVVEVDPRGEANGEPVSAARLQTAGRLIGAAVLGPGMPLAPASHSCFLERRHIEAGKTLFPCSDQRQPRAA